MNRREVASAAPAIVVSGHYHPFVDGLKAVAILAVVLYHVGIGFIPGGFIGVDVFFVISGFLIINQIAEKLRTQSFSFVNFWTRRALRILPPYLLVIVSSAAIAPWILVFPDEYRQFGEEVAWSAAMAVNFLYLGQEGYFDAARDTKILLHLWSLAVEEQFYLLAPVAMVLLWRFRKSAFILICATLFLASFAACIFWTAEVGDRNYAFYLMPLRAWEFMVGGVLVAILPWFARLPRKLLEALCLVGIFGILLAAATFKATTAFPSYIAAVPVAGTALVIVAGLANPHGIVIRMLSLRPVVFIGLISYSWYLWHWPLLTFSRIYDFGDRHLPTAIVVGLVSLALAIATRYLLERPIKSLLAGQARGRQVLPTALIACVLIAIGGTVLAANPPAVAPHQDMAENERGDSRCNLQGSNWRACPKAPVRGLLVGDSHAASARGVIERQVSTLGGQLYTMATGGCVPILTAKVFIPDGSMARRCEDGKAQVFELLADEQIDVVFAIMFARWPLYTNSVRAFALGRSTDNAPARDQRSLFVEELRDTLATLNASGVQRVLIIGPTPEFSRHIPRCAARAPHYGMSADIACGIARASVEERRARVMEYMAEALRDQTQIRFADPIELFCDRLVCKPTRGDEVLFTDTNHLSDAGMTLLLRYFQEEVDWVAHSHP